MRNFALPPDSVPVPNVMSPSLKVTVPVGADIDENVTPVGRVKVIVAVNVTG